MNTNNLISSYLSPMANVVELQTSRCIASSISGDGIDKMDIISGGDLVDETYDE